MAEAESTQREIRSFLMPRDPSIDRRFRPRPQQRIALFHDIKEEDDDWEIESSLDDTSELASADRISETASSGAISDANPPNEAGASVYLRLRPVDCPTSAFAISKEGNILICCPPHEATNLNKNSTEKHYSFTDIFDSHVGQHEIYEKCIGQKIITEESFTVLTYGTSGSGKTFTLLGDDHRPGIIPRSLENLFSLYEGQIYPHPSAKIINGHVTILEDNVTGKENLIRKKILAQNLELESQHKSFQQCIRNEHRFPKGPMDDAHVLIWVTFVEIYNEQVHDLLDDDASKYGVQPNSSRKNLKIICNDGRVFIKSATSIYVKSSLEALKLLRYGQKKLKYASTSINANSSRSHCIFLLDVLKYYPGVIKRTSYKFCDLAGSERLDKTGNVGSRLKEAQRINTSLMVLGISIDIASALQGREKLTMVVNLTPLDKYYEENSNVLNFASIARNIIFKSSIAKQNHTRYSNFMENTRCDIEKIDKAKDEYIHDLTEENARLHEELQSLRAQLEEQEQNLHTKLQQLEEMLRAQHSEEMEEQEDTLRNKLVDSFKTTLAETKRQGEKRLQVQLNCQAQTYETKIASLIRKYEAEIEDLEEELERRK
uniref:Kinesin motor domain-containing protein n=1 Tax=Glossina pallidipes TaxID=7398 RepID=A0A1B0A426_GLOPL